MRPRRRAGRLDQAQTRALLDGARRGRYGLGMVVRSGVILVALLLRVVASAADATADDARRRMSPEEFRAFSEGWTLHFEENGRPFGAERYFEGGEVLWKPEGGPCVRGFWSGRDDGVCFLYADAFSCWRIWRTPRGVAAEPFEGGDSVEVVRRDRSALDCSEIPVA